MPLCSFLGAKQPLQITLSVRPSIIIAGPPLLLGAPFFGGCRIVGHPKIAAAYQCYYYIVIIILIQGKIGFDELWELFAHFQYLFL